MKEDKIKLIYSKYDNINKSNNKRKDSKQAKALLLIKDYFNHHSLLTKDRFNEFLIYIDLKSIWTTKEEQNFLWNSLLSYSSDKITLDYNAALKGILDFFKPDDEDIKNKSNNYDNNNIINDIKKETLESFNKYLKNINEKQEYLYDIEIINYIFFDHEIFSLNNNKIENIINDIKLNYKFITITEKEIKNYFNCFKSSNINKDLINEINSVIENNFEQNKNNNIILNDTNNFSRSISFSGLEIDTNNTGNSCKINHCELFGKLEFFDKIISDFMDSLINFCENKNLIDIFKKYIQNYILPMKKNIYNNLRILIENGNKRIESDSKISEKNEEINKDIINSNKLNNNFGKNINLNKMEKSKTKYFSNQDIFYIKSDLIEGKFFSNILNNNDITNNKNIKLDENENENKDNILKKNESEQQLFKNSILYKKAKHNRNKSDMQEKLMFNFNNKLKKNISYCNFNKLNQIKEIDIFNINNKGKIISRNNYLTEKNIYQTQRDDDSSFYEGSIEDLNIFSFNENLNDQIILEKDNINYLDKDNKINLKGTPTLDPFDSTDNKISYYNDGDCNYYEDDYKENKNEQNINIEEEKEKNNLSKCQNPNNFTFGKDENNKKTNTLKIKLPGDIDVNIQNYSNSSNNLLSSSNKDKKFIKLGHYDFKYLYKNNHIKRLFAQNNDQLNAMKFLTDEVYIIPNNNLKKTKSILVISSSFLYLLKSNSHMACISKINVKSLKSISISSRNCNLILFTFNKASDIFLETYRRIEILTFIKEVINKNIKINISHSCGIKKKVGENDSLNSKKSKMFINTPNFENAQKFGILYKYQENFFSASFHERLVVLCCLGLMYFEENEKCPKVIIPIIGTSIKTLTINNTTEKLYCFQLKVKNDENYIFGSKIKKEIIDWINEFSLIKKKYFLKLKEIEPSIILNQKNKFPKKKKVLK
jgi:hypothetical protein